MVGTQVAALRASTPPEVASPPAVRLRSPGWRDPRLLIGIVLVAGSVAIGTSVFATADRTTPVYAADGPLVAGDPVTPDSVAVRHVRLGESGGAYLPAEARVGRLGAGYGERVGTRCRLAAVSTPSPMTRRRTS